MDAETESSILFQCAQTAGETHSFFVAIGVNRNSERLSA